MEENDHTSVTADVLRLEPDCLGSLRLTETDVLGRLGAVVSPVGGTAELRLQLAQQRARVIKSEPASSASSSLQEAAYACRRQDAYNFRSSLAMSAKSSLESEERKVFAILEEIDRRPQPSTSAFHLLTEQEEEVRKARVRYRYLDAEDAKNLGELGLQCSWLQGDYRNGQHSLLSAVRASALARTRNMEDGARSIDQIRRARADIVAARDRQKLREAQQTKQIQRPSSSPALQQQAPNRLMHASVGKAASAPASAVAIDEQTKQRWIQHVRESLQYQKSFKKPSNRLVLSDVSAKDPHRVLQ
jgi:hypothetical protein